ncbi:uncharacterized protein LOC106168553 [Lingula anatina]|uniref:Uncharacterized protein LOC106168553 n=1 Tax=Lingula anatina TaxID=7574 RepID=A0A1S3IYM4_LINAN|nr:uncharacterized protein LOC106168553 [Lingula anatina]|eukprot:XP_013403113.1 uncharacterized protein LOC106168553 [Lingula anatina]
MLSAAVVFSCHQGRLALRIPSFIAQHELHLSARAAMSWKSNGDLYEKFVELDKNNHDDFQADTYNRHYNKLVTKSDEEKVRKILKWKILKRKYFSPPPETNLLTWDAKEQIRYLHREFPQEWTVDRLSESFPVSRHGIIQILKSSYVPRDLQEITKHDNRVNKNWQLLTEGGGKEGGPVALLYEELVKSGNIKKMKTASGIPGLPVPERKMLVSGLKEYDTSRTIGPFEALVQKEDSQMKMEAPKKLESGSGTSVYVIDDQVKDLLNKVAFPEGQTTDGSNMEKELYKPAQVKDDYLAYRSRGHFSQFDENDTDSIHHQDIYNEVQNEENATSPSYQPLERKFKRGRGRLRNSIDYDNKIGQFTSVKDENELGVLLKEYQYKGTRKLSESKDSDGAPVPTASVSANRIKSMEQENLKATDKLHSNNAETAMNPYEKPVEKARKEILDKIKYDKDPYVYDYETGYQKPFGTKVTPRDSYMKIKVSGSKARFYQKDNVIYDENGEFLIKIPT